MKLIVIGTSTGGLGTLKHLTTGLPADFPAAVMIVMHIGAYGSLLPELLETSSSLPVRHAKDKESIRPGVVLVAPPDRHLHVEHGTIKLTYGPKENYSRPTIDPLFRPAAMVFRQNTIGVLLTGTPDDGTVGLQAIKAYGGTTIVQDPLEAKAPCMPLSALQYAKVNFCLPITEILAKLIDLASQPESKAPTDVPEWISMESHLSEEVGATTIDTLHRRLAKDIGFDNVSAIEHERIAELARSNAEMLKAIVTRREQPQSSSMPLADHNKDKA
jgi:two-component system chemotaxis response regulator CheB